MQKQPQTKKRSFSFLFVHTIHDYEWNTEFKNWSSEKQHWKANVIKFVKNCQNIIWKKNQKGRHRWKIKIQNLEDQLTERNNSTENMKHQKQICRQKCWRQWALFYPQELRSPVSDMYIHIRLTYIDTILTNNTDKQYDVTRHWKQSITLR